MIMKRKAKVFAVLLGWALLWSFASFSQSVSVFSPDKRIEVKCHVGNGSATYEMLFMNRVVIRPSGLGFLIGQQNPGQVYYALGDSVKDIGGAKTTDISWKPIYGEVSEITDHYNHIEIPLVQMHPPVYVCYLVLRVYNDGMAFRYNFPEQDKLKQFSINDELTEFNFAKDYTAWWMKDDGGIYEQVFQKSSLSKVKDIFTPVTLADEDSLFMAVNEAAMVDYAAMSLVRSSMDSLSLKCDLAPWPDGTKVKSSAPCNTPWRYILISDKLSDIVESKIILNLNEPCRYKDVSWIKPQKFTGIFWAMHTRQWTWKEGPLHGATTAHAKSYIDFAAAHHIDGLLMEGWNKGWETWAVGDSSVQDFTKACPDLDLAEVVAYAKKKGVNIIGHHETGGNIPLYESQMSAAFKYYSHLGIHSVKTGYSGTMIPRGTNRHGQQMVNHYQSVVDTAAKYHIMIDSHEPIMPTGLTRTYPNLMTGEAVRGMEWCNFDPWLPSHLTTLPYTRSLAGPFDFTIGIVKLKYDTLLPWFRVNTTLANQLALYVVFYSPMQMVADLPENLEKSKALSFLEKVPVCWDESRLLLGKIGEYTVMARRKGEEWYLGAITNEQNRILTIPLNFLPKAGHYTAEIYSDSSATDWYNTPEVLFVQKYSLDAGDTLHAALAKGGGIAIRITPARYYDWRLISNFNKKQESNMKIFANGTDYGFKTRIKHIGIDKKVMYENAFSPEYSAGGDGALTDGVIGTQNYRDGNWQGIQGKDLVVNLDMAESVKIHSVTVHFFQYLKDWIFIPKEVNIYVSDDGKSFEKLSSSTYETIPNDDRALIKDFTATFPERSVRFIKLEAKNAGLLPQWHHAAGNESWIFCDEVIVK
jgi:alpha-glucosidase